MTRLCRARSTCRPMLDASTASSCRFRSDSWPETAPITRSCRAVSAFRPDPVPTTRLRRVRSIFRPDPAPTTRSCRFRSDSWPETAPTTRSSRAPSSLGVPPPEAACTFGTYTKPQTSVKVSRANATLDQLRTVSAARYSMAVTTTSRSRCPMPVRAVSATPLLHGRYYKQPNALPTITRLVKRTRTTCFPIDEPTPDKLQRSKR